MKLPLLQDDPKEAQGAGHGWNELLGVASIVTSSGDFC